DLDAGALGGLVLRLGVLGGLLLRLGVVRDRRGPRLGAVGVGVAGTGLDRRLGGLGRRERDGSGGLGLGCGGGGGGLGGRLALRGGLVEPRGGGRERRRDRGGGEDSEDAHLHRPGGDGGVTMSPSGQPMLAHRCTSVRAMIRHVLTSSIATVWISSEASVRP